MSRATAISEDVFEFPKGAHTGGRCAARGENPARRPNSLTHSQTRRSDGTKVPTNERLRT